MLACSGALAIAALTPKTSRAQAEAPPEAAPEAPPAEAPPEAAPEAPPAGAGAELAPPRIEAEAPEPAAPPPEPVTPPPPPPAPPPAPPVGLVPTGSFFGRYEVRANYDDLGVSRGPRFIEGDALFYRARLGLATTPISIADGAAVSLQFTPQAAGVLGTLPNTLSDAMLGLHEGYLRIATSAVRFDLGRFELNYGDSLVIGSLDWNEFGRSFDGMRMRVAPAGPTGYYVDVFATMLDEGRPDVITPFAGGDHYFVGVYAGLGPAIATGLDLDVYALGQIIPGVDAIDLAPADPTNAPTDREGAVEATLGVRVKQKVGMLDYRAEAGVQLGRRVGTFPTMAMGMPVPPPAELPSVDTFAYHIDAEIGVTALADTLRVGLEGIIASGDDPTTADKNEGWNELYPTAHKFLGLADVFHQAGQKRTNVGSGVLHVTGKPAPELTLQLDGHVFTRLQGMTAAGQDGGFAGAEIDAGVAYALGKGLGLRTLYAVFVPGQDFYPQGPAAMTADEKLAHYLEIELRYDLK